MAKEFNIEGNCIPGTHYMADTTRKMQGVMDLVSKGKYFIINRPRQYGKTTTLFQLAKVLGNDKDYLVLHLSFAGIGDEVFKTEKRFCQKFVHLLYLETRHFDSNLAEWLEAQILESTDLGAIFTFITEFVRKTGKRTVLLVDEVDKSSNNQLFVSFLAMLREKYLNRSKPFEETFHSIILAGVHDVKSLKLKLRPEDEKKLNSPWDIAAPFEVDMNLFPDEILPMLEDYMQEKGVSMDAPAIAERLFYFTSGYPFLVSMLCKLLDEKILPKKSEPTWTESDVELAADLLLKDYLDNTNFESLVSNLENYPELYKAVYNILMEGEIPEYNPLDPVINLGLLHGIFRNGRGIRIHNRIYSEVILNYMTSKVRREILLEGYNLGNQFRLPGNRLNAERVLLQFQAFLKEQYSRHDRDFLEKHGRLVFLSFLRPIINGNGYDFKEVQISMEKPMDVAVTFFEHRYIFELKIWRGKAAHDEGLAQLADYLDLQGLSEGYLLIFDHAAIKTWHSEWLDVEGKRVFAVWV